MNEMIFMTPPQSGQSNGSTSKTFLVKRAQVPRAVFAAAIRRQAHHRQAVKTPFRRKRAVVSHDVEVRMEIHLIAVGVHANHEPGLRLR